MLETVAFFGTCKSLQCIVRINNRNAFYLFRNCEKNWNRNLQNIVKLQTAQNLCDYALKFLKEHFFDILIIPFKLFDPALFFIDFIHAAVFFNLWFTFVRKFTQTFRRSKTFADAVKLFDPALFFYWLFTHWLFFQCLIYIWSKIYTWSHKLSWNRKLFCWRLPIYVWFLLEHLANSVLTISCVIYSVHDT